MGGRLSTDPPYANSIMKEKEMKSKLIRIIAVLALLVGLAMPSYALPNEISLSQGFVGSSTSTVASVTSIATQPMYVTFAVSNATPAEEVYYIVGTETLVIGDGTGVLAGADATFEIPAGGLFSFISTNVVDISATCTAVADHVQSIDIGDSIVATSTTSIVTITSVATKPIYIELTLTSGTESAWFDTVNTPAVSSGTEITTLGSAVIEIPALGTVGIISSQTMSFSASATAVTEYSWNFDAGDSLTATSTTSSVEFVSIATKPTYITITVDPATSPSEIWYDVDVASLVVGSGTSVTDSASVTFELAVGSTFLVISDLTTGILVECNDVTSYTRDIATAETTLATSTNVLSRITNSGTVPMLFTLAGAETSYATTLYYKQTGTAATSSKHDLVPASSTSKVFELAVGDYITVISTQTMPITIVTSLVGTSDFDDKDIGDSFSATATVGVFSVDNIASDSVTMIVTIANTPADAVVYYGATSSITFGGEGFAHAGAGESFSINIDPSGSMYYISNEMVGMVATISLVDETLVMQPGTGRNRSYASPMARTIQMPNSSSRYKLLISPQGASTVYVKVGTTATVGGTSLTATRENPLFVTVPPGMYVSTIATSSTPIELWLKKVITPRRNER